MEGYPLCSYCGFEWDSDHIAAGSCPDDREDDDE